MTVMVRKASTPSSKSEPSQLRSPLLHSTDVIKYLQFVDAAVCVVTSVVGERFI
jgi:hypothetical protein